MKSIKESDSGIEYVRKMEDILSVESRERILQDFIISPFIQNICTEYDVVPVDIKVSGKYHNYELYCGKYGYKADDVFRIVVETPDLCIAKNWQWNNQDKTRSDYIFTVEIKTVFSNNEYWISPGFSNDQLVFENSIEDIVTFVNGNMLKKDSNGKYSYSGDENFNKNIEKQVGVHIRGINKVIVTDGIRWMFFYKTADDVCHALPPIDLGKRICKKARKYYKYVNVNWDFEDIIIKGKNLGKRLKNYELLKYVIYEFGGKEVSKMNELLEIINKRKED